MFFNTVARRPLTRVLATLAVAGTLAVLASPSPAVSALPVNAAAPEAAVVPITASGTGTVSSAPDTAFVSVGATVTDTTSAAAQDKLNKIIDATIKAVKALDVPGLTIQTQWVSVQPQYDYKHQERTGEPRLVGYMASNTVSVTISDPKQAGKVIDAAIGAGGNTLNGVSFLLKNDASAKGQALGIATTDARAKADAIAAALGLKITRVIEASTGVIQRPYSVRGMEKTASLRMMDGGAPTPIETGTLDTTAEVSVIFAAEPK